MAGDNALWLRCTGCDELFFVGKLKAGVYGVWDGDDFPARLDRWLEDHTECPEGAPAPAGYGGRRRPFETMFKLDGPDPAHMDPDFERLRRDKPGVFGRADGRGGDY